MNTAQRASMRFANIALHRDPTLSLRRFLSDTGIQKVTRGADGENVEALCAAFEVPALYWSEDTDDALVRHLAGAAVAGESFGGEVTPLILARVAWLEQLRRGHIGTPYGFVRERTDGAVKARSWWASVKNGNPTRATLEIGCRMFDLPAAYWTLTNYADARAVASGEKTIGVIAA